MTWIRVWYILDKKDARMPGTNLRVDAEKCQSRNGFRIPKVRSTKKSIGGRNFGWIGSSNSQSARHEKFIGIMGVKALTLAS